MTNLKYLEEVKKEDERLEIEIDRIANNSYPNNVEWARKIRLTFRKVKALEIIAETLISIDRNIEFMAIPHVEIPKVPNIVIQDTREAQKKVKK